MASHVVVVDSSARRATIKTTPGKHLVDVRQEACTKLGLEASEHYLRHNNKQLELSYPIRLSGLTSGARLELIRLSRSPSVISVALQLPEQEVHDAPNGRLIENFPSTTTLWQVLRQFESGGAGGSSVKTNFTARGMPKLRKGETQGSGRLYYETPVLSIMGRECSSFTDLQRSLGQLGLSQSVLIRLSFRITDIPLEEAMQDMDQYFKDVEKDSGKTGAHSRSAANIESVPGTEANPGTAEVNDILSEPQLAAAAVPSLGTAASQSLSGGEYNNPEADQDQEVLHMRKADDQSEATGGRSLGVKTSQSPNGPKDGIRNADTDMMVSDVAEVRDDSMVGPGQRVMSVFAPPSNTTPQAAKQEYRETDYEPTIEHAKIHQSRLLDRSRNKRLPSESELQAQKKAASDKLASVSEVEIKVRFPDQSTVVCKFNTLDTAGGLYEWVSGLLDAEDQPFLLSYNSSKGSWATISRDKSNQRLIQDLGFSGKMLINFKWDENASQEVKRKVLKDEFRNQAKEIVVPDIYSGQSAIDEGASGSSNGNEKKIIDGTGKEKKKGAMPKWLKGISKK